jgi:hypothetical protein
MKRVSALIFFALGTLAVSAAPFTRELVPGLNYVRVASVVDDLPVTELAGAVVLDLRYAADGGAVVPPLLGWIERQAKPAAPVLVLANVETSPELRRLLGRLAPHTGLLVIGPPAKDFQPDIAIATAPEVERQAYDALSADSDLATLLAPVGTKLRYDEAAILEARAHGEWLEEEPEPELTDTPAPTPAAPLDLAVQRAVHVYQAWSALRPR